MLQDLTSRPAKAVVQGAQLNILREVSLTVALKTSYRVCLIKDFVLFLRKYSIGSCSLLKQEVFSRSSQVHVAGRGSSLHISFR